jgi:hypothetical protein
LIFQSHPPTRHNQAVRIGKGTLRELETEETVEVDGTGQPEFARGRASKPEAAVVGLIADEQDRAVAATRGLPDRMLHEHAADALSAHRFLDRYRPEQQRRTGRSRFDIPKADRADEPAGLVVCGEGEPLSGKPAFPQTFGGFPTPLGSEGAIEQGFPRRDIALALVRNGDHLGLLRSRNS